MSGQVNIQIPSNREGHECKWEVNGMFWMEGGVEGEEENIKQIPHLAALVAADSPGRKDQYGMIKAVVIVRCHLSDLLYSTSARLRMERGDVSVQE